MYTYIIPFFSGVNNNNQQQQPMASSGGSRNNGNLDYEIDALDNFPDPASGDFDPTNSLSSSFPGVGSHPVDIAVQSESDEEKEDDLDIEKNHSSGEEPKRKRQTAKAIEKSKDEVISETATDGKTKKVPKEKPEKKAAAQKIR